jgi:hypothetical protein
VAELLVQRRGLHLGLPVLDVEAHLAGDLVDEAALLREKRPSSIGGIRSV